MKIYATNSGKTFGNGLAEKFSTVLNRANVGAYPDGQVFVRLIDIPNKEDVIVVGNTQGPTQFNELGLLTATLRQHSVRNIYMVMPYFGAGRQDEAKEEGQDVAAKYYADVFSKVARPDWLITIDIHKANTVSFFDGVKTKTLEARPLFIEEIRNMNMKNFIFVSADVGRLEWARKYAKKFGVDVASIDKRREKGKAEVCDIIGVEKIRDKHIIFVDDILDTGGTALAGAQALKDAGAQDIHLFVTHGVFSGESYKKFKGNPFFAALHMTDSIDNSTHDTGFRVHSLTQMVVDFVRKDIR